MLFEASYDSMTLNKLIILLECNINNNCMTAGYRLIVLWDIMCDRVEGVEYSTQSVSSRFVKLGVMTG